MKTRLEEAENMLDELAGHAIQLERERDEARANVERLRAALKKIAAHEDGGTKILTPLEIYWTARNALNGKGA